MADDTAEMFRRTAIVTAVLHAGSQSALARIAGVSPQAVSKWVNGGRVSAECAMRIERSTLVKKEELCPEVFGQPLNVRHNSLRTGFIDPDAARARSTRGRTGAVVIDELAFQEVGSVSGTTPAVQIDGIFNRVRTAFRIISRGTL